MNKNWNSKRLAINKVGPLANPPVPITIFGLNACKILIDCTRLTITFNGNNKFEKSFSIKTRYP